MMIVCCYCFQTVFVLDPKLKSNDDDDDGCHLRHLYCFANHHHPDRLAMMTTTTTTTSALVKTVPTHAWQLADNESKMKKMIIMYLIAVVVDQLPSYLVWWPFFSFLSLVWQELYLSCSSSFCFDGSLYCWCWYHLVLLLWRNFFVFGNDGEQLVVLQQQQPYFVVRLLRERKIKKNQARRKSAIFRVCILYV